MADVLELDGLVSDCEVSYYHDGSEYKVGWPTNEVVVDEGRDSFTVVLSRDLEEARSLVGRRVRVTVEVLDD